MIEFRDRYARRSVPADRPHQYRGDRRRHAAVPGRDQSVLRRAEDQGAARRPRSGRLRRGVRRRAARRGALAGEGTDLLAPRCERPVGSEEPAPRAVAPAEQPGRGRAKASAYSRSRTGRRSTSGLHPCRKHPGGAALLRQRARSGRARRVADSEDVPVEVEEKRIADVLDRLRLSLQLHPAHVLRRNGCALHRLVGQSVPSGGRIREPRFFGRRVSGLLAQFRPSARGRGWPGTVSARRCRRDTFIRSRRQAILRLAMPA